MFNLRQKAGSTKRVRSKNGAGVSAYLVLRAPLVVIKPGIAPPSADVNLGTSSLEKAARAGAGE